MNRVRLGAVGYLNARPLVFGLEHAPDFHLRFDVPSRCAELLHGGGIDVGLIPSIEYLRSEGAAGSDGGDYQVAPGLAIASRGAVASVALYTTKPMSDVRSIALDVSSRTSVALVSVLCARHYRIGPRLASHGPDLPAMLANCDAALLIGDKALFQSGVVEGRSQVEKIDLGAMWTTMTGLPFVWAFWAGRSGALTPSQVVALQKARDAGIGAVETIAREYFPESPDRQKIGADYLRDNIKYHFGPDERAGVELFYRYAAEAGVVGTPGPLRFFGE